MNEEKAREILNEIITVNDGLRDPVDYVHWMPYSKTITLDAEFTVEKLEAIVWWMKNKKQV